MKITTGFPTDNKIFYTPDGKRVISLGRIENQPGRHVCRREDGSTFTVGGYWLSRTGDFSPDDLEAWKGGV